MTTSSVITGPDKLLIVGIGIAAPAFIGGFAHMVVDAFHGDSTIFWVGLGLAVVARVWAWAVTLRDRREAEAFAGTVKAITVNDRGDGRDAYRVEHDGQLVFTLWAAPGRYRIGEKLAMRQWVERR